VNFIQKRIWVAWSKFRFLRLPVEKRVRLEVTTDGRHLTFILVSLYEAGYGVQVFGGDWFFRELMLLRKTAPIPFLYGGKESECGISISDKSGFNHRGHGEHGGGKRVLLDYNFFSGLTTKKHESEVEELTTIERQGGREKEQPQVGPKGEGVASCSESYTARRGTTELKSTEDTDVAAGLRLASQASASEPDSLTSKLAHAPLSESLIRSADGPTSSPATTDSPLVTAPEAHALDARPSTLDSSVPVTSHSPLATALRAPYFMHPSVYHRGLHKRRSPDTTLEARRSTLDSAAKQRRRFRIGFFGTHDREFYTQHYHFPGMNRCEILEVFLQNFGERITHLRGFPRDWEPCEIAVSIDGRGGDRQGKSFLSQDHYFEALRECDFVLSPPGICMPISHNLIEAMFCGAVPITNAGAFMAEPLSDGETCLEFKDVEGLVSVIKRVLAMDEGELARMRNTVRDYYNRFLDSKAILENLIHTNDLKIIVNAEEKSVPMVYPDFVWPPL
jgi:hypothetical protein